MEGLALKQKTETTNVGLLAFRQECKKPISLRENKKLRTTTTKSPREFAWDCSFPILYSFGVDEHYTLLYGWLFLLLEDCAVWL